MKYEGDPEKLYELFRAVMQPYVNAARGTAWDDARERAQFLVQLDTAAVRSIVAADEVVGFVDVRSGLLQAQRISLTVLKTNPRARAFYERAGFRRLGATEHHHQLVWTADGGR